MDDYKAAQKRVHKRLKKRIAFFTIFIAWIIICSGLFIVNALTSSAHWWAIYPFVGWGLSVAFQAYEVFGKGLGSNAWEERMTKDELSKMGYDHEQFDLDQPVPMRKKEQAWDDRDLV